jgi:hypothetical protein
MDEDGYKVGSFGSVAIGVVTDVPRGTTRTERARLDGFTGGELLLGSRVAVDVEQVLPRFRGAARAPKIQI